MGLKLVLPFLAFVFLFKIGEAFLGRMSLVFYKEIGFSKGDIAIFSKALGWITTIVFTSDWWRHSHEIWNSKNSYHCWNSDGWQQIFYFQS